MKLDGTLLRRLSYLTGITMGVYLAARFLLPLVIPFLLAAFLARFLYPVTVYINKKMKIPYRISSIILVLAVVTLICVAVSVIAYYIAVQTKGLVANYPVLKERIIDETVRICYCCDEWLGIRGGRIYGVIKSVSGYIGDNWSDKIMPALTKNVWDICTGTGRMIIMLLFVIIGTALMLDDYGNVGKDLENSYIIRRFRPIIKCLRETMGAYIRTQFIIIIIITTVCTVGLMILGNSYALLIGIAVAFVDALPILGSGSVLVPWTVVYIFSGDYIKAAIVLSTYVVCLIVREFLEPKIMGQQTGLRPLYTFISFYVGIKLFGIAGIILGPLGTVLIRNIYIATCGQDE